jgi:hypothetical protein
MSSVLIFFFFSSLFSCERLIFRGASAFDESFNGGAIRTIGGGGDGLDDIVIHSLWIDGGEGEISTNSFGECNGDKIRDFFSSLIGFVGIGTDFFFGGIDDDDDDDGDGWIFFLIGFEVWGFLLTEIGSFVFSGLEDSCGVGIGWV